MQVLRNGASLLAERVWLPPDRRKPTRLRLRFEDPLLLLPRNVHALRSEESLAEASVSCELAAIDVSNSLRTVRLPGVDETLLADRV